MALSIGLFLFLIGPFAGGTQLSSLVFLWHLGGPAALFVHELFRYRRGLGQGRGARFAFSYFAVVDFVAVYSELGRGGIFIWLLFEVFPVFLLFLVLASAIGLGFGLWIVYARGERNAGDGVILLLSASLASLCAVGSVYGIRAASRSINHTVLSVRVLDATSGQPIGGADVEFVGHIVNAIPDHKKTDKLGTVKLTDQDKNRLEITQVGYRGQIIWFENGMVHVSWQEDGLWRPFDRFDVPQQLDHRPRSLTVYLRRNDDGADPPYPFPSQRLGSANMYRMLSLLGYHDDQEINLNEIDVADLTGPTKERFLAYRQRHNDFYKRLFNRDHAKGWRDYRPEAKRTNSAPYCYWNHHEQRDNAALHVYSLLDGVDDVTAYSCVDELFSAQFRSCREDLYATYTKANPGGRLAGICLLQSMLWHRKQIEWIATAHREKRSIGEEGTDRGKQAFLHLQALEAESKKHHDPLVRYLATSLLNAKVLGHGL